MSVKRCKRLAKVPQKNGTFFRRKLPIHVQAVFGNVPRIANLDTGSFLRVPLMKHCQFRYKQVSENHART